MDCRGFLEETGMIEIRVDDPAKKGMVRELYYRGSVVEDDAKPGWLGSNQAIS
jgi:hypothetical protein